MKKAMLLFLLAMLLLTLTACGEAKKYEEAQALMKGGAYSEAYEAFAELGRYEDAKQLAEDAKWALYARAQSSHEYIEVYRAKLDRAMAQRLFLPTPEGAQSNV